MTSPLALNGTRWRRGGRAIRRCWALEEVASLRGFLVSFRARRTAHLRFILSATFRPQTGVSPVLDRAIVSHAPSAMPAAARACQCAGAATREFAGSHGGAADP